MTYPVELRERVIRFYQQSSKHTYEVTASIFNVGVCTVRRWVNGFIPTGQRTRKTDVLKPVVAEVVQHDAFVTYARIQEAVLERTQKHLSFGSICSILKALKVTRKRVTSRTVYGSVERIEEKKRSFRLMVPPAELATAISIDETYFHHSDLPRGMDIPRAGNVFCDFEL
jgi:transposase